MKCPKCGHTQPTGQECVQCGIIFEKFFAIKKRQEERSLKKNSSEDTPDEPQELSKSLLQTYFWDTFRSPWRSTPNYGVIALTLFFAYLFFLLYREPLYELYPPSNAGDSMLLGMISRVNLVFHEGGHAIFGIFGNRTLTILGGSLNQVLVPAIVTIAFWRHRDPSGFAFGLVWLFINFLGVAIYMADAREPFLPLIANLDPYQSHDWRNLFNQWDLWSVDTLIAKTTYRIGWIGMIGTALWYVWINFLNSLKQGSEYDKEERPIEF